MAGNNIDPIDSSRNYPRFCITKYEGTYDYKREIDPKITFVKHRKGRWDYVHEPSVEYRRRLADSKFHKKYRGRFDISKEKEERENRINLLLVRLSRCKKISQWNGK